MHVYVVDNADWFVARDADDALEQWAKLYGEQRDHAEQLPDDQALTVRGGETGLPDVTKTCAEWARDEGWGLLGSVES